MPRAWLPHRTGPHLTPGRVWRRGRELLRDGGPSALAFTILADLGYGRLLLLERLLDQPIAPVAPRVPVVFSTLAPAQLDEYRCFHGEFPRSDLEARLARGDEGVVARYEGRIVCVSWASRTLRFFNSLGCPYSPGPREVYLYDSFVDPAFRGLAIAPALGVHVLEGLRGAGVTRAVMAVSVQNVANRRARAKTGFRVFERMDYLRLGRRTWHWHRRMVHPS